MTSNDSNLNLEKEKNNNTPLFILVHLLGIFTGILGALIIYFVTNEQDIKEHAKNALNWQLSLIVYTIVMIPMIIISTLLISSEQSITTIIGIILISLLLILFVMLILLDFVFTIIATIKASENKLWKYPLSFKFLK